MRMYQTQVTVSSTVKQWDNVHGYNVGKKMNMCSYHNKEKKNAWLNINNLIHSG